MLAGRATSVARREKCKARTAQRKSHISADAAGCHREHLVTGIEWRVHQRFDLALRQRARPDTNLVYRPVKVLPCRMRRRTGKQRGQPQAQCVHTTLRACTRRSNEARMRKCNSAYGSCCSAGLGPHCQRHSRARLLKHSWRPGLC